MEKFFVSLMFYSCRFFSFAFSSERSFIFKLCANITFSFIFVLVSSENFSVQTWNHFSFLLHFIYYRVVSRLNSRSPDNAYQDSQHFLSSKKVHKIENSIRNFNLKCCITHGFNYNYNSNKMYHVLQIRRGSCLIYSCLCYVPCRAV